MYHAADFASHYTMDEHVCDHAEPRPAALARGVVVGLTLSALFFWFPLVILMGLA